MAIKQVKQMEIEKVIEYHSPKLQRTQLNSESGRTKTMAVQKQQPTESKGNQPLANERAGSISLAIFENNFGKSAVLQKSYKKDDKWVRQAINMFLNEIPKAKEVIDKISVQYAKEIQASMKKTE